MPALSRKAVQPLISAALREDRARRDLTSQRVIPSGVRVRARIIAKAHGVAAGVNIAARVFAAVDPSLHCRILTHSGAKLSPGKTILTVEGRARSVFAAERTALNFLGHLCGIATLTRQYVERTRGTRAQIFDTRKTLPGLRALEKDAVLAGGGHSHRADLAEAVLIKTNHLKAATSDMRHATREQVIQRLVAKAKLARPRRFVEIEVTSLPEFKAALKARPDAILLDNWPRANLRKAVSLRKGTRPIIEVSGGITLNNVRRVAGVGVDRISIGRLTHSAPTLDVSLQMLL